jgi:hypothetical protein
MAHRVFAARQDHRTAIARGVFAERDLLDCTIGKGQREVGLFVNCRGNRANVGIVSEDADQMRLLILSYIGGTLTRILVDVFSVMR